MIRVNRDHCIVNQKTIPNCAANCKVAFPEQNVSKPKVVIIFVISLFIHNVMITFVCVL